MIGFGEKQIWFHRCRWVRGSSKTIGSLDVCPSIANQNAQLPTKRHVFCFFTSFVLLPNLGRLPTNRGPFRETRSLPPFPFAEEVLGWPIRPTLNGLRAVQIGSFCSWSLAVLGVHFKPYRSTVGRGEKKEDSLVIAFCQGMLGLQLVADSRVFPY